MPRYQGRTYDTCITLGNNGEPWCPTLLDAEGGYIEGQREKCLDRCLVTNCPVGFYRNIMDHTCYYVSPDHARKRVSSVDEAEEMCRRLGASLWEPRTESAQSMLIGADLAPGHTGAITAIGLTYFFLAASF